MAPEISKRWLGLSDGWFRKNPRPESPVKYRVHPHGAQDGTFPELNHRKHATTQDRRWQRRSSNSKQMETERTQEATVKL